MICYKFWVFFNKPAKVTKIIFKGEKVKKKYTAELAVNDIFYVLHKDLCFLHIRLHTFMRVYCMLVIYCTLYSK